MPKDTTGTDSGSNFWKDLANQFRDLQAEHDGELRANWTPTTQVGESGRWYLSGTRGGNEGRRLRTQFEWLAEKAAVRLGHPGGPSALFFWLDLLKTESPYFRGGLVYGSRSGDGPVTETTVGVIEQVCAASADYCLKCETQEMIKTRQIRTGVSALLSRFGFSFLLWFAGLRWFLRKVLGRSPSEQFAGLGGAQSDTAAVGERVAESSKEGLAEAPNLHAEQKPEPRQPLPASVTNGSDPLQAGSGATADRRVKAVFCKRGEFWEIGYEGKTSNLRDRKAFHFISKLLRERGKKIPALELAAEVSPGSEGVANGENLTSEAVRDAHLPIRGTLGVGGGGDVDDMIDGPARRQYRERLAAIPKEREVAKENQDSARLAELDEEVDQIEQEITAATGHGGKIRKFSSPEDRARSNVTMQIKAAIQKISDQNPKLGSHLHRNIKTGMDFSYQPDPATDIHWNP